jgi:hypothetical protein
MIKKGIICGIRINDPMFLIFPWRFKFCQVLMVVNMAKLNFDKSLKLEVALFCNQAS